jgi:phosphoglycolate phosphatase
MRDEKSQSAFVENSTNTKTPEKISGDLIDYEPDSSFIPHPSSLKILLWDIDGTLMYSNRPGAYKEYFIPTLEKVYGKAGNLEKMQVSGMTDPQIAFESLRHEGFQPSDIFAKIDEFVEVLGAEMSRSISASDNPYGLFNGVREILSAADSEFNFVNSLLTGNLSVSAEIKLRHVNIWHFFEGKPHSFGEISHQRNDLAWAAGKKFNEFYQTDLKPEQFIIIGDTPNDIACARSFGAKAVAVATGRSHSADELAGHCPDLLLEDLSETSIILDKFKSL